MNKSYHEKHRQPSKAVFNSCMLSVLVILFCGCGARANRIVLKPPLPVEHNETLVNLAAPIELGRFSLVRAPENWRIAPVSVHSWLSTGEPSIIILRIDRAEGEPIECSVSVHTQSFHEQEWGGQWPIEFMFRDYPQATHTDFEESYPSNRDLAVAWSNMQPGDASKGECYLNRKEQVEYVLAYTCRRFFSDFIPVRLHFEGFSAFVGGMSVSDRKCGPSQPRGTMWLIPDNSSDRITVEFWKGFGEPGPYETFEALALMAAFCGRIGTWRRC